MAMLMNRCLGASLVGSAILSVSTAVAATEISSGAVALQTDADVPVSVPEAVTAKAAFWMDMSEASVVSADGGETLSVWRDCRETADRDATPVRYYAVPAWTNGGEGVTVCHDYAGVGPAIATVGEAARKALDFHGRSGIYLRLKKDGADARLYRTVRHVFAVQNPSNWFGSVVGGASANREGAFLLTPSDKSYLYKMANRATSPLFWNRTDLGELGALATSVRLAIDGEAVDPFAYCPHLGWQLLDAAFTDAAKGGTVESVFFQRYEDSSLDTGHRAGGDFLSELIVFTNQLSRAEIASVRAYLNAKWGLPAWRDPQTGTGNAANCLVPPAPVEEVVLGSAATATATVVEGTVSRPFALSGDGRLVKDGAGDLAIGASQGRTPFAGELELKGGAVLVRGGCPPAFTAQPNRTLTAEDYVPGANTPANQALGGVRVSLATGGDADAFVKAGECPATVSDVEASVKRICVTGGELTLGAPSRTGYRGEVDVENGDMEAAYVCPSGDSNYSRWAFNLCAIPVGGLNGWFATQGSAAYFQRLGTGCTFADGSLVEECVTSDGKKWRGAEAWNVVSTVGTGSQFINVQVGVVYAKVKIPTAGCYEILFDMSERRSLGQDVKNARPLTVLVGKTADDWQTVAHCQGTARFWTPVREVTPKLEAGEWLLGFSLQDIEGSPDCSAYIDNVRVRFASVEPRDSWPIPNGDFEQMDVTLKGESPDYWSVNYWSLQNVPKGWTLTSAWGDGTFDAFNPAVGLVNPNIHPRASTDLLSADAETPTSGTREGSHVEGVGGHGTTALLFAGDKGTASTTFTPPAGTWRLRHRLNRSFVYANQGKMKHQADEDAAFAATVTIGGAVTDLGVATRGKRSAVPFARVDHPTSFTTDGQTAVTLTISNANANVGALVDDLELVGETSTADREGELVADGSFEAGGVWQGYSPSLPAGQVKRTNNQTQVMPYLNSATYAYGAMQYDGEKFLLLKNLSGVRQTVDFPAAGLYRLRFALRSRADSASFADGDLAVSLVRGEVTNRIAFVNYPYQRNFTERTYLFRVPEAGSADLCFENYGPHAGRGTASDESTCLLDGVSVCRVDWDVPESLSLDPETRISLSADGALNLAFTGTNVVRAVRKEGVASVGREEGNVRVVDAASCPDFVSGPGTLLVERKGSLLMIR